MKMQEYFARAPKYWSERKIYLSGKHGLIEGKTYTIEGRQRGNLSSPTKEENYG